VPRSLDHRALLTGWGGTHPTAAQVLTVAGAEAPAVVKGHPLRGVIARGLGRAYGDAAQNAGGEVLRLDDGPADGLHMLLDEANATLTCGAGVSVDEVLRLLVPHGFFVPVTAGTRFVTVAQNNSGSRLGPISRTVPSAHSSDRRRTWLPKVPST
jgi:decaprenylphospho-beta-D-ribofuranose 2-oxidase